MTQEHSSPLTFPCDFLIKAMGKNTPDFRQFFLALIQTEFPEFSQAQLRERISKDQTYVALSAPVFAQNQTQLDLLYQALSSSPEVLMAL